MIWTYLQIHIDQEESTQHNEQRRGAHFLSHILFWHHLPLLGCHTMAFVRVRSWIIRSEEVHYQVGTKLWTNLIVIYLQTWWIPIRIIYTESKDSQANSPSDNAPVRTTCQDSIHSSQTPSCLLPWVSFPLLYPSVSWSVALLLYSIVPLSRRGSELTTADWSIPWIGVMSTVGAIEKSFKVGFLCISYPDNTINKMYQGWMKFLFPRKQTQICQKTKTKTKTKQKTKKQKKQKKKKKTVDLLSLPFLKFLYL